MSLNRIAWTMKPPPGTPLRSGALAPDRVAMPFNESAPGSYLSYANPFVIGSSANIGVAQGRNGPRVHITGTNQNNAINLVAGNLFVPTASCTILLGQRKQDSTLRASAAFGFTDTGSARCGAHVPYSDGIVYWDWDNITTGRVTASGLTFGDDIFCFTAGPRGQEIWQNGVLRAANSNTAGRASISSVFWIAAGNTILSPDLVDYDFFFMWSTQISPSAIQELSINPFSVFASRRARIFGFSAAAAGAFTPYFDPMPELLAQ